MSRIVDELRPLAEKAAAEQGCELWDLEYTREAGERYLRVYIDREGGVSIDDCEAVSRRLDPVLDEMDLIPESYIFEVSSAGAERALKQPSHFARFAGSQVEVKLYRAEHGAKRHSGRLLAYEDGAVFIEAGGRELRFTAENVAGVRLRL